MPGQGAMHTVHDSKTQIASHPLVQQLGSWLGAHTAAAHAPHAGSSGGPAEHTSHVAGMVVVVVVLVVVEWVVVDVLVVGA